MKLSIFLLDSRLGAYILSDVDVQCVCVLGAGACVCVYVCVS